MSTTTFLEMSDTQMLDYSTDSDFTMHATGHSVEWLPVEATMSDDSFQREYSETVEIEMDHNDDDEITEYEMADGEESYGNDVAVELEDVDFTDPPSMTSPQRTNNVNSPLVVDPPLALTEPLLHASPVVYHEPLVSPHDTPGIGEQHSAQSAEVPPIDVFTPTPILAVLSHESLTSPLLQPGGEPDQDSSESHVHVEENDPSSSPVVAPVATTTLEQPGAQLSSENDAADSGSATHEADEFQAPTYEDPTIAASDGLGEQPPHDERVQATAEEGHDDSVPTTAEESHDESFGNDPHEISDGVYIDPPPAVLLSLSSSSERIDCCLFNQPQPRSGSQSPNAYASTSAAPDVALLLSPRPTLYYEPLNNVFEAFRQEEMIASIPEFAAGELVLEAYDLDLRISEENVHAGEVTLHELNVLHDGIDLTGPLRLRLSAVPRFITRYHALREQVAQLTLAVSLGDEPHTHEETNPGRAQSDAADPDLSQALSDELLGATTNVHEETLQEASEPPANETPETAEPEFTTSEHTADEFDGSEQQTSLDPPQTSFQEEEDHNEEPLDDETERRPVEYGTELTVEEAVESLDADKGHQVPDAEEGGDYVEYAQQPADDEESFGEALPEDLGGQVEVADSQQKILQSFYEEPSTESEEASAEMTTRDTALNIAGGDTTEPLADNLYETGGGPEPQEPTELLEPSTAVFDDGLASEVADNEPRSESDQINSFEDFEDGIYTQIGQEESLDQEPEEWGEYDDDDEDGYANGNGNDTTDALANVEEDDHPSIASSHTLSTLSKRSRDDDDDGTFEGNPPHSPDSKRLRSQ